MAEETKKSGKFLQWLFDSIYKPKPEVSQPRTLTVEDFYVSGISYYEENIKKLACQNPDWKKHAATIVKEGKAEKRIFRHNYVNKPVKLVEDPNSSVDQNTVQVFIAGEIIGYINFSDNIKVKNIINNREIKSISGFIGGGDYKIVHEDGNVDKGRNKFNANIRIKYI